VSQVPCAELPPQVTVKANDSLAPAGVKRTSCSVVVGLLQYATMTPLELTLREAQKPIGSASAPSASRLELQPGQASHKAAPSHRNPVRNG